MKYWYSLLIVFFLFTATSVNAQEKKTTYIIINKSNVDNIDLYKQALSTANLDKYRLENTRRVLKFDTGVEAELLSLKETETLSGKAINRTLVNKDNSIVYPWPFSLNPEGFIVEKLSVKHKNK